MDVHGRRFWRPGLLSATVLERCGVVQAGALDARTRPAGWGLLGEIEVPWRHRTSVSVSYRRFRGLVVLVIAAARLGGVVSGRRRARCYGRTFLREYEVSWAFWGVWFRRNGRITSGAVHRHLDH